MTTCELIIKPIVRMVEEEKKSLDEIAAEVCPKVKHGREKIIRVIKDFISEEYLFKHAIVLGYDVGKAQLAKKRIFKSHKKIDAREDGECCGSLSGGGSCNYTNVCGSEERPANSLYFSEDVHEAVQKLVDIFGINRVQEALNSIIHTKYSTENPSNKNNCPDAMGDGITASKNIDKPAIPFSEEAGQEQKILEYIRASPKINIFDLAKNAELNLKDVINILIPLVEQGKVIKTEQNNLFLIQDALPQ